MKLKQEKENHLVNGTGPGVSATKLSCQYSGSAVLPLPIELSSQSIGRPENQQLQDQKPGARRQGLRVGLQKKTQQQVVKFLCSGAKSTQVCSCVRELVSLRPAGLLSCLAIRVLAMRNSALLTRFLEFYICYQRKPMTRNLRYTHYYYSDRNQEFFFLALVVTCLVVSWPDNYTSSQQLKILVKFLIYGLQHQKVVVQALRLRSEKKKVLYWL